MGDRSRGLLRLSGLLTLVATAAHAQSIVPQPFPPSVNFPVPTATVQRWVASIDEKAIRGHAWDLWAAMALPSNQTYEGQNLPIWETWYGSEDIFRSGSQTETVAMLSATRPRGLRTFIRPRQFDHDRPAGVAAAPAGPGDRDRLVSFNKFNPDAADFIVKTQPGPGNKNYVYNKSSSLQALNAAWPQGTSGEKRAINEFPAAAIELKPVFSTVKASGLTALPMWQGPANSTDPGAPTPSTWTACMLIDPAYQGQNRQATAQEIARAQPVNLPCKSYAYGALSQLYSFRLSAREAQSFAAASGAPVQTGDYSVLVAMHVTTKEIPFWTWQTFWWQPGLDVPPGSKAGQPANLTAPWTSYASCTNYDQTTTPGGKVMQICYNPYLETGIQAGLTSNCMSCHGVARVTASGAGYPSDYKAPIAFFSDPRYFNDKSTHTDFSWAVAGAP